MEEFELAEVPIGLGCALEMFSEKNEILRILESLPEVFQNSITVEISFETYQKILDRYQEQPHLLDPHLEQLVNTCLDTFRSATSLPLLPLKHLSLKFLRQIFKVRGRKEVVKRMPHEISELVLVLTFLESMDLENAETWESGYVLILWLSILVMNPFSLKLLDGASDDEAVSKRLMNLCFKTVVMNSCVGEAGTTLIANFLTRPDMEKLYMSSFIQWATARLSPQTKDFGVRVGAFGSLAVLFKHAKREEVLCHAKEVIEALTVSSFETADTVIRKLGTKLLQRIGQIFLKIKIASWRYQRGSRSLLKNLQGSGNIIEAGDEGMIQDPNHYEELREYSGEIEKILDWLLGLLKDKDTVVRWSAAKGVGRVTNRLPQEYGDEVVESVLGSFTDREQNGTWHGGCLALAELARRGLLLPGRLPMTIVLIQKALIYDEIRGNFSVGSHVRDAACYVIWAFARAFDPAVLAPYVSPLASSLIITMLFDREINCRRAASAAFQENVGRQGSFPHGIEIVTLADYYVLGNRRNSFTKVSIEIGQFQEYVHTMVDHLVTLKYNHFDPQIRELSAVALGNFVFLDKEYLKTLLMKKLVPLATTVHTPTAHGALISICQIMRGLSQMGKLNFTEEEKSDIRNIVMKILHKQFRELPLGYIPLREAVSKLIKTCAEVKFPVHEDKEILETWHAILEDHISSVATSLRQEAGEAFPVFLQEYYYQDPFKRGEIKRFVDIFVQNLKSTVLTTRMGYALLLGKLPPHILRDSFGEVITKVCKCALISSSTDKDWADARREAVNALGTIISYGLQSGDEAEADWRKGVPLRALDTPLIISVLKESMNDYTTDKRGDIGSWVRLAAMETIKIFLITLHNTNEGSRLLTSDLVSSLVALLLKQCVEKIDNIRVHCVTILTTLVHFQPPIQNIPYRSRLQEIFPLDFDKSINLRSSTMTYPIFLQLLPLSEFTQSLLSGLVIGGGSLALSEYLNGVPAKERTSELRRISTCLVEIFKENEKIERVTIPLMQFLTKLFQSGVLVDVVTDSEGSIEFGFELIQCIKNECIKSPRVEKILAGVELLAELIQGTPLLAKTTLSRLVVYLCHSYPRVRTLTAAKIYEALLTYEESMEEVNDLETGMSLLSETDWTQGIEIIRPIRNKICSLLSIPIPVLLPKSGA